MSSQRGREVLADVVRPQVLVLDVDQPVGLGDRLGVAQHHRPLALGCEVEALGHDHRERADDLHHVVPVRPRSRWRRLGAQRLGHQVLAVEQAGQEPTRVHRERGAVLPALAERRLHVVDRGALDGHLDVVPRRRRSVGLGELDHLAVAVVVRVVAPAVAQVDPADVGEVAARVVGVADHHELLVVRAAGAHAHVPQALAAGLVDLLTELAVPVRAVPEAVPVGAPQQPTDLDAAPDRCDEHGAERRAGVVGEQLVGVALPVGEVEAVPGAQLADALVELGEVRPPVHDGADGVAAAPRGAVAADLVDPGVRVLPLLVGQEPLADIDTAHRGYLGLTGELWAALRFRGNEREGLRR